MAGEFGEEGVMVRKMKYIFLDFRDKESSKLKDYNSIKLNSEELIKIIKK